MKSQIKTDYMMSHNTFNGKTTLPSAKKKKKQPPTSNHLCSTLGGILTEQSATCKLLCLFGPQLSQIQVMLLIQPPPEDEAKDSHIRQTKALDGWISASNWGYPKGLSLATV